MKTGIMILLLFFITSISIRPQWVSKKNAQQLSGWNVADCIDALSTGCVIFSANPPETNIFSVIYQTDDNGLNWNEVPLPTFQWGESVVDISIVNKSTSWVATSGGKIYKTTNRGLSWEKQFDNQNKTKFINYIDMFDENNGIAMGDALIRADGVPVFLKTTNSGNDWVSMNNN